MANTGPGVFAIPMIAVRSPGWPGLDAATPGRVAASRNTPMSQNPPPMPPRHLTTPEAARFLSLSTRTLEKHRTYGTGPTYRKIGGRVIYTLADLEAWTARGARTSTSEVTADEVRPAKRHAALSPSYAKSEDGR